MKVLQGIQIKIYPNRTQRLSLNQMFGNDRFLWNQLVAMLKERYHNNHKLHLPSAYDLNYLLKPFKNEYPFMKNSDSSSLQIVTTNLIQTYQMFFQRPHQFGKPRFHSRKNTLRSYVGKSKVTLLKQHYLKLPKLGILKVNGLQQLQSNDVIKRYEVSLRPSGQYYLSLQIEREKQAFPKTHQKVGIDLGLHDLAITSDHQKYPKLNFQQLEKTIKHWQKKMDRRKNETYNLVQQYKHNHKDDRDWAMDDFNGWQKAKIIKARRQRHLTQQRHDILQKITTALVKKYDVIVIEDLKVKNMLKNHKTAHAISNHAWSTFRRLLDYKCQWYQKQLLVVNPRNTSRICHFCHQKNHAFDGLTEAQWLEIRNWTCPNCHQELDRDVNAAQNILQRGIATI